MSISDNELKQEKEYLDKVLSEIKSRISILGQDLYESSEKINEFKKFIWDNKGSLDAQELRALNTDDELEIFLNERKGSYFKKLYRIQNSPYFASIKYQEEDIISDIYIGITYLEKDDEHLIYDWRSPICSIFYDFEVGECSYNSPSGIIKGNLLRKRQYKIEDQKLIHVFDNSINIDDDLLQDILATTTDDKMKNIVNTIQQEQNKIIRNTTDKNLIVQGIAGSGKTSVALHRIAFLLYKQENLNSNNILIFSPNEIFSTYISNVLPELGEDNTKESTFHDFLKTYIKEYKQVESFTNFIERYYKEEEKNEELVRYKQSNEIIKDFTSYLNYLVENARFLDNITDNLIYNYTTYELNYLLNDRYCKYPLFERINFLAEKFSYNNYNGKKTHIKTFNKLLLDSLNIKKDYKKIYAGFFNSKFSKIKLTNEQIKTFVNKNMINYEDALLFVYMKCFLEGYPYNNNIKQIVIDEAQDYNKLQYIILKNIFSKASFTILGDINQTINPYYKYKSLYELSDIFTNSIRYLELTKTYRSTKEIIEYTNKILGLEYVSAIRKENSKDVLIRKINNNFKKELLKDITYLTNNYKSVALISKDIKVANMLYELLKDDIDISLIDNSTTFKKDLIIIPAYIAKGLEFDSVIIYNDKNMFKDKYLYYVAATRAQHELIIYE